VHITARTDYALRAVLALAAADPATVTAGALAAGEGMPLAFLKTILSELRGADLIVTQRGPERGYRLTRPATDISVGEVIRVVDGSLTDIRGEPPAPRLAGRRHRGAEHRRPGDPCRRRHRQPASPRP
jgi:Rrf2 family protein